MARQWAGRIALGIMGVSLFMGVGKAHARAAITDYEAGKLTFDALTATPVYHRPVVHLARRSTSHSRVASNNKHHAMIRTVAYHPHAAHTTHVTIAHAAATAHHATHHRRT